MPRRRSGWRTIPGTPARCSWRHLARDGVSILCVRLAGWAENTPDGVARVKDGLDALASSFPVELDVTTLDVTLFANATDDACAILTSVFAGLPCCWITHEWDQQHDGRRWDLPHQDRMAPTREDAIARVIAWRRAGGFSLAMNAGADTCECEWTARGLAIRNHHHGELESEDLWHKNQLVERLLADDPPRRVLWPVPDRTGIIHEALRRGARLVYAGERVVDVDFGAWSTGRPLANDWVEALAGLETVETLLLRDTDAREPDILRAVAALPHLETLAIEPGALGPAALAELQRQRLGLVVR